MDGFREATVVLDERVVVKLGTFAHLFVVFHHRGDARDDGSLTDLGRTLIPIIEQLRDWGDGFRPRMEDDIERQGMRVKRWTNTSKPVTQ